VKRRGKRGRKRSEKSTLIYDASSFVPLLLPLPLRPSTFTHTHTHTLLVLVAGKLFFESRRGNLLFFFLLLLFFSLLRTEEWSTGFVTLYALRALRRKSSAIRLITGHVMWII